VFKKCNVHPKMLNTSDCVVRAITKAKNADYMEVRKELNRSKNELGFESYKDTKFIYQYLKDYQRLTFKAIKGIPRIKGDDFTSIYSKGVYILKMAGHITAVIDGVLYDTWDCTHKTVYTAWKIQ